MFQWLRKTHFKWMSLDPSKQFMAWVVVGVIASGLTMAAFMGLVASNNMLPVPLLMGIVAAGIVAMLGLFVYAVIFLTVIWPHHYEKRTKKNATI